MKTPIVEMFGKLSYSMVRGNCTIGAGEGCKAGPPPSPVSPAHKPGRGFNVPKPLSGKSVH